MVQLLDWQQKHVGEIIKTLEKQKPIYKLNTGGGKTVIASAVAKHFIDQGLRVWFITHTRLLYRQTAQRFESFGIKTSNFLKDGYIKDNLFQIVMIQQVFNSIKVDNFIDNLTELYKEYTSYYNLPPKDFVINEAINDQEFYNFVSSHNTIVKSKDQQTTYTTKGKKIIDKFKSLKTQEKEINNMLTDAPSPDLIIVDECHHIVAGSYLSLIQRYKEAKLLGLTATPRRNDNSGIGIVFDCILNNNPKDEGYIGYKELYETKRLCAFRVFNYYKEAEEILEDIKIKKGDFDGYEFFNKFKMPHRQIPQNILNLEKKLNTTFKGVIFVPPAYKGNSPMRDTFDNMKDFLSCSMLDGSMSNTEINHILQAYIDNKIKFLIVCNIFTEGVDIPDINLIVNLRPTTSHVLCNQLIGRGLRYDKNNPAKILTIMDYAGLFSIHNFPNQDIIYHLHENKTNVKTQLQTVKNQLYITCGNTECNRVYEIYRSQCPSCNIHTKYTTQMLQTESMREKLIADFESTQGNFLLKEKELYESKESNIKEVLKTIQNEPKVYNYYESNEAIFEKIKETMSNALKDYPNAIVEDYKDRYCGSRLDKIIKYENFTLDCIEIHGYNEDKALELLSKKIKSDFQKYANSGEYVLEDLLKRESQEQKPYYWVRFYQKLYKYCFKYNIVDKCYNRFEFTIRYISGSLLYFLLDRETRNIYYMPEKNIYPNKYIETYSYSYPNIEMKVERERNYRILHISQFIAMAQQEGNVCQDTFQDKDNNVTFSFNELKVN
jgi:superfamily II DNA or RNA helicase